MIILPDDMYDAVPDLVHNIPANAKYVAGYVDSISFTWPQSAWDRFPNAVHITISTRGIVKATAGDRETGDLSPQQAYDDYQKGLIDIVYCNFAAWQGVQDVFNVNHKSQPPYWIAEYPGGGRVLPVLNGVESVAHQYQSTAKYDLTCITDTFLAIVTGVNMADLVTIQNMLADVQLRVASMHAHGFTPVPGVLNAPGGDLTWFQQQYVTADASTQKQLAAILSAVQGADVDIKAVQTDEDERAMAIATAIANLPAPVMNVAPTDAQMATLEAALSAAYPNFTGTISINKA